MHPPHVICERSRVELGGADRRIAGAAAVEHNGPDACLARVHLQVETEKRVRSGMGLPVIKTHSPRHAALAKLTAANQSRSTSPQRAAHKSPLSRLSGRAAE